MKNPDHIYKLAEELVTKYQDRKLANANEATTRFQIIDVILNEILEWNKDDIEVEETHHDENGTARYCDYIIRTANTAIIVEAKKVGVAFDTVPQKRKQRLRGAWLEGNTGDAIRQARQYCIDKNIQFAVVTNGGQWIIFPAFRDDEISFKDSNAIIFDSLQQTLGEDLNYFTSLLSREGVINGYLREELLGRKEDQIETRRLNSFKLTDIQRPENPIYPLIEEEITQAFSDTSTADRETLINCYVQTPDRKRFDTKIQFHINKRDSLFRVAPKNPMKRKQRGALDSALNKTTKSAKPLAMLILGTVGSGKSTFLKYTREVSAASFFAKKRSEAYPHWIDINFLEFSPSGNVLDFIYESIYKYIESDEFLSDYDLCQKHAYEKDIESMKRGPLKRLLEDETELNREIARKILNEQEKIIPYVEKILEWSATKSPVFLVVDNVDQMPNEELQSTIFADAIALASKLGINLLLSMRESTYVQHRNSPTFDAFDFDTLQIDPPDIHAVLSKRFTLASKLLENKEGEFRAANGAIVKTKSLADFIDIVQRSVLGTEVGTRIEVLANRDIRLALRMTRSFLERGYTDPGKAMQATDQYTLPKHEAFRSIILGNSPVYVEQRSVIGNPFDARLSINSAQILRMFVLSALVKLNSQDAAKKMDGEEIKLNLLDIGYSDEIALSVLEDLCDKRFVSTSSHGKPTLSSNFFPTILGGYIVKDLLSDLTFLECMMMDTFIDNFETWKSLKNKQQRLDSERNKLSRLHIRMEMVGEFYSYVRTLFENVSREAHKRSLPSEWLSNPFKELEHSLNQNIERAVASANRLYKKGHRR